jgi:DNA-directed RNA polymerase specialized sigma24 family protein
MSYSGRFPTTVWSMVQAARSDDPNSPEAMNRFISGYWRPVFYFLRAKGYPLHRAEDLTQEFFLRMFERDWIRTADANRGRFRTFLLTILNRFLSDQGPARAPKQIVFDQSLVSVSALVGERERTFEPSDRQTPEQIFMKQWAKSVVANSRNNLEAWCRQQGRTDWFEIFTSMHFFDSDTQRPTQQALADRLRISRDQVRYGMEETTRQFAEFLRAEVAEQVESSGEIDDEIRELETLIGG